MLKNKLEGKYMLSSTEARKLMATSLVNMARNVAVLLEENTSRVSGFVDEVAEIACEMMPKSIDPDLYFRHFADGLTDGFAYEYIVEDEVDQDQAASLIESGALDTIAKENRFKAACFILDMREIGEFPDSYDSQDEIDAAFAYTDGYHVGMRHYSYNESAFGEPAMYVRSSDVKATLEAIAQE